MNEKRPEIHPTHTLCKWAQPLPPKLQNLPHGPGGDLPLVSLDTGCHCCCFMTERMHWKALPRQPQKYNSGLILCTDEEGVSSPGRLVPSSCFWLSVQYPVDSQESYLKLWAAAIRRGDVLLSVKLELPLGVKHVVTLPATVTRVWKSLSSI